MAHSLLQVESLDQVARLGIARARSAPDVARAEFDALERAQSFLAERREQFNAEAARIRSDGDISEARRAAQLAEIGSAYAADLGKGRDAARTGRAVAARLREESYTSPAAQADSPAQAIREGEVRDALRRLDPTEAAARYIEAVSRGDTLVYVAIERWSSIDCPIPETTREHGRNIWAERQAPEIVEGISDLIHAADMLEGQVAAFDRELHAQTGVDTLALVAAGKASA